MLGKEALQTSVTSYRVREQIQAPKMPQVSIHATFSAGPLRLFPQLYGHTYLSSFALPYPGLQRCRTLISWFDCWRGKFPRHLNSISCLQLTIFQLRSFSLRKSANDDIQMNTIHYRNPKILRPAHQRYKINVPMATALIRAGVKLHRRLLQRILVYLIHTARLRLWGGKPTPHLYLRVVT